jgi:hypothetical protein
MHTDCVWPTGYANARMGEGEATCEVCEEA